MPSKNIIQTLTDLQTTMTKIQNSDDIKLNSKQKKRITNQICLITNSINHQNMIPKDKQLLRLTTHFKMCQGVVKSIHKESLSQLNHIQSEINIFAQDITTIEEPRKANNNKIICYSLADSAVNIFAAQLDTMPDDKRYQEKKQSLRNNIEQLKLLKQAAQSTHTHKDIHHTILDKIHNCLEDINRHTNPTNSLISKLRCGGLWRTETHIVIAADVKNLILTVDKMLLENQDVNKVSNANLG